MLEMHLRELLHLESLDLRLVLEDHYKKQEIPKYISHNDLYKSFFQHNYLTRTTASYKAFFDKANNIANDGYQKDLATMVDKYFDKKTSATHERSETLAKWNKFDGSGIKNENISNK